MYTTIISIIVIIIITLCTYFTCKELENTKLKKHILFLFFLVSGWIILHVIKYKFVYDPNIKRFLWYLYYIPIIYSTTIFFYISTWHYKNKKKLKIYKIISLIIDTLLLLILLTNDFHQLVFKTTSSLENLENNYTYGFTYYILYAWLFINIIISIYFATKDSTKMYKTKKITILIIMFLTILIYSICYTLRVSFLFKYIKDFTIIYSLFYILALIIIVYKERYRMSLEDNLYSEIEEAIKDKTIIINNYINDISKSKNKKRDLSYIKLLVSYCKGKSNLVVTEKNIDYYTSEELKLVIDTSIIDVRSLGINGALNIKNKFEIPVYTVSVIYDYIYSLYEYTTNYQNTDILIFIEKTLNHINIKTMLSTNKKLKPFTYKKELENYILNNIIIEDQNINDNSLNIDLKIPIRIEQKNKNNLSEKEIKALLKIKSRVHDILGERLSLLSSIIDSEKIDDKKLEENLLEMTKMKEERDKKLLHLEIIMGILCLIPFFALIIVAGTVQMEEWLKTTLVIIGVIPLLIATPFAIMIEQKAGYYECSKCHHKYIPKYMQVFLAPHVNRTRYMKCPKCLKKSWNKKIISK